MQVRKLGEGFDHPFLSVAAVFSIFTNLSPFVQFVGRIMRVIKQNSPEDPVNRGTVIFHAGANVARRWAGFQQYSEADKAFFVQLLPMEALDFSSVSELEVEPQPREYAGDGGFGVAEQTDIELQEIPLIQDDPAALAALTSLRDSGYSSDQVIQVFENIQVFEKLQPVPTTKLLRRQAARKALDQRVRSEAGRMLHIRGIRCDGHRLDHKHLGMNNFTTLKSAIDKQINHDVGRPRDEFTQADFDRVNLDFERFVLLATEDVFNGQD